MTYRGGISGTGPVAGTGPASWAAFAILAVASTMAACYRPSVIDGKLQCGPANACPDGYGCVNSHCWQGGVANPAPDGGSDDLSQTVDMSEPEVSCLQAVPGCIPSSTGVCDPVCQTGCGCQEKCSFSSTGEVACVPALGQNAPSAPCNVDSYGAPGQTDDCAPGNVCLYPGGTGTTRRYCFALCSSDDNCPSSRCVTRPVAPPTTIGGIAPTATVCDTPFTPCNPIDNTGCTDPDRSFCYLAPPDPVTGASRTQCEYYPGAKAGHDTCDWSRDCAPRLTCPQKDSVWPGAGFCLLVCDATHPCTAGGTCKPYGSTYGYCVST